MKYPNQENLDNWKSNPYKISKPKKHYICMFIGHSWFIDHKEATMYCLRCKEYEGSLGMPNARKQCNCDKNQKCSMKGNTNIQRSLER